jgi:hypothetical protein
MTHTVVWIQRAAADKGHSSIRLQSLCENASFRVIPRNSRRRGISHCLENTQGKIPRSARNDSIGMVITQSHLGERVARDGVPTSRRGPGKGIPTQIGYLMTARRFAVPRPQAFCLRSGIFCFKAEVPLRNPGEFDTIGVWSLSGTSAKPRSNLDRKRKTRL